MADGDRIIIGQANTASKPGNETSLSRNEGTANTVFVARNQNVCDGIHGESVDDTGVTGTSDSGDGVRGSSDTRNGVTGFSGDGVGMAGFSSTGTGVLGLERVMNLGENRIEMRIPRSAWFLRDLRFPHS
jgi:hypothetical protein